MEILTNIKYGWCDFDLGGYHGRPSYIRFLPFDVLSAYEEYFRYRHCIIEFDEELSQFCLVIWDDKIIIIDNREDKCNNTILNMSGEKVLVKLVNEIVSNVDVWAKWISIHDTDESIQDAKNKIIKKIKSVGLDIEY